ncbi:type I 3-dehydroquinate dehydratase [Liquorilactobacillus mali]|uniref:3-dehydroquinate dehydratase n=1 Tax=Liquorilactobacillus mali KCTC 3596 = DSM 20444 TaxID=1046596 RepID=J1F3M1_9LACO|nr:type I 3-dehydroquinate dehydratase [Liquorilactobacillus mali]EJE99965.1 3-dehydroquinate dehydratase [Liquorilactobacillus mali KCTC 3596 = DSM 20444]KRN11264.1 3-dehydroquinate dehydratase [Liquorilactobacillus mali KCTC 3596 = DSM 20444]QFQ73749.1 type I 3-dehydroquinate dehydratase [Liquorilactobacillus mali]
MKSTKIRNVILGKGRPKIAVPVTGKTEQKILEEAREIVAKKPDLIEWRIDFFQDVTDFTTLADIAAKIRNIIKDTALLVTFRTYQEGGNLNLPDEEYFKIIRTLIENRLGDAVDIERYHDEKNLAPLLTLSKTKQVIIIMSNHDFYKTPSKHTIVERLQSMEKFGADVAKIAVMPIDKKDVLELLSATQEASESIDIPIITMSMGDLGKVSRICGETFGSSLTFASVTAASAPGQIELTHLRQELYDLEIKDI